MKKISQEQNACSSEAVCARSEADIIKDIEAGNDIPEGSLDLVMKVIFGEFSADILFSLIKNGYELSSMADCLMAIGIIIHKIPEDLIYTIVDNEYMLDGTADSLLIMGTAEGRLSEKVFRYMLENNYIFSDRVWEEIFETGIDFMVDAYVRRKH